MNMASRGAGGATQSIKSLILFRQCFVNNPIFDKRVNSTVKGNAVKVMKGSLESRIRDRTRMFSYNAQDL